VTFLLRPNDESGSGAKRMVDVGTFDDARVEAEHGLHTWPGPTGTFSTRSGGMMASIDDWRVVVHGKQAHGALLNGVPKLAPTPPLERMLHAG